MEKKTFVKLLRKIIREEVTRAVRTELRSALKEQKTNHKQVIEHGMNLAEIADSPNPYEVQSHKKKKFTKNSLLNDLLNETANTADFGNMAEAPLVMQGMEKEWPEMKFNSTQAKTFQSQATPTEALATHDVNGAPVNMSNESVAKTVNIMTKDYSALMKAIDKKKGIK